MQYFYTIRSAMPIARIYWPHVGLCSFPPCYPPTVFPLSLRIRCLDLPFLSATGRCCLLSGLSRRPSRPTIVFNQNWSRKGKKSKSDVVKPRKSVSSDGETEQRSSRPDDGQSGTIYSAQGSPTVFSTFSGMSITCRYFVYWKSPFEFRATKRRPDILLVYL